MPNGNERPIEDVLKDFYIYKLELEQVDEDKARKDLVLEEIIENLQNGTDYIEAGEYDTSEGENLWDDSDDGEGFAMSGGNHKALLALQEARLLEEQNIQIDWDQLRNELGSCPQIPQAP